MICCYGESVAGTGSLIANGSNGSSVRGSSNDSTYNYSYSGGTGGGITLCIRGSGTNTITCTSNGGTNGGGSAGNGGKGTCLNMLLSGGDMFRLN